ncbi:phosphate ABC transporter ATP-binding protein [Candidatus Bathyarchaeota archaeon]|nr:phosphate ABC transporter ATP-binding protein [Candidatus Bathyarchaeota archaeon]
MDLERPVIRIKGLNVSYGKVIALRDVSVDIPRNGITTIIGPSGCGKTTLLKSMNRLVELYPGAKMSGAIIVDGEDVFSPAMDVTDLRRRVGLITQTPNPLPMSIYENVAYGPRIHGERDTDAVVERCLRSSGLWEEVSDRLGDPAVNLSLGQQQRLNLARALAVEPEVLLCDEPTSALDPVSATRVEELLRRLSGDYSIVMVTHTLRQAKRLADYSLFMYMGELVEHSPAEKFFKNPVDPRTREYIEGVYG